MKKLLTRSVVLAASAFLLGGCFAIPVAFNAAAKQPPSQPITVSTPITINVQSANKNDSSKKNSTKRVEMVPVTQGEKNK